MYNAGCDVKRSILAIGAHADDIEISVGGTCAKYLETGYEIIYVMATNNMSGDVKELQSDGNVKISKEEPDLMAARRRRECEIAAAGFKTKPIYLDHPQRHYHSQGNSIEMRYGCSLPKGVPENVPSILTACENPDSIENLAKIILRENPECIFTHGVSQSNIEHFATGLLVTNAFWHATENGYEGALLHWREAHTLHGEINCRWETFIDCSRYLDRKMELIGMHRCQMPGAHLPEFGHRLLTVWWGKACGTAAAEVFTWVRRPTRRDPAGPTYGEITLELIQNSR